VQRMMNEEGTKKRNANAQWDMRQRSSGMHHTDTR
jgi:hypothetical protein